MSVAKEISCSTCFLRSFSCFIRCSALIFNLWILSFCARLCCNILDISSISERIFNALRCIELTEDVDYDTDEQYAEKLNVIKNSYFKSSKKDTIDNKKTAGTNNPVVDGTSDSNMDGVMNAISNLSKK